MKEVLFFINSRLYRVEMKEESECKKCIQLTILVDLPSSSEYARGRSIVFERCDLWIPSEKIEKISRIEYHCFDDNIRLLGDGSVRVVKEKDN